MELKAFIVDDERLTRNTLIDLLREFCPEVTVCGTAGSMEEALAAIRAQKIDILFLDINLGCGHTGFDLLNQLGQADFDIVFVTGYEQYALKAFEYAVAHYLLKPVDHEKLIDTVGRILKRKEAAVAIGMKELAHTFQQTLLSAAPRIALSDNNKTEFVPIKDIVYLESNGSYTVFCLNDKRRFTKSKHLKHFEDALNAYDQFIRVHKCFVVNKDHIRSYRKSSQELEFINGALIPVSMSYKVLLELLGNRFIS